MFLKSSRNRDHARTEGGGNDHDGRCNHDNEQRAENIRTASRRRAQRLRRTMTWFPPRYSNGYAHFELQVISNVSGTVFVEIRELDNGHSYRWNGQTNATDTSGASMR